MLIWCFLSQKEKFHPTFFLLSFSLWRDKLLTLFLFGIPKGSQLDETAEQQSFSLLSLSLAYWVDKMKYQKPVYADQAFWRERWEEESKKETREGRKERDENFLSSSSSSYLKQYATKTAPHHPGSRERRRWSTERESCPSLSLTLFHFSLFFSSFLYA